MRGDPTTTIETLGDGRFVITHCFFDVNGFGSRTWEVVAEEFKALGLTVEPIEDPRLNFRMTLPAGAFRGTGVRSIGNMTLDVFIVGEHVLYILRPEGTTTCRTLLVSKIADVRKVGIGNFWRSFDEEVRRFFPQQTEAAA